MPGPLYNDGLTEIKAWISNYIHSFLLNVITHPHPQFGDDLAQPS